MYTIQAIFRITVVMLGATFTTVTHVVIVENTEISNFEINILIARCETEGTHNVTLRTNNREIYKY